MDRAGCTGNRLHPDSSRFVDGATRPLRGPSGVGVKCGLNVARFRHRSCRTIDVRRFGTMKGNRAYPARMRRARYSALLLVSIAILAISNALTPDSFAPVTTSLAAAAFILVTGWASVGRLHDRGRSGWTLLAALIPLFGPLWLVIELCCRRGVGGPNSYGPDPRERLGEYLVVS